MFSEDLSIFLEDFGVPCGGAKVLIEESDDLIPMGIEGAQIASKRLVFATGSLAFAVGQTVTAGGQSFKVRSEPRKIDDGAFSEVGVS